ncbi:MAG: HNH endonuclease [Candidatus Nanoarchaeia archaeon]|nr:HNH endonuclease [Candidatus Nanoarchaeia archaeon]MDD5588324.1 HNH endonuclease [Candidatus Nanoarchaeia archaeon]
MTKNLEEMSQADLIMEYFKKNSKREIKHPEIVDWAVAEWKKRTGEVFRDPDRAIRKLSQGGQLIKISKGIYKYDPDFVKNRELEDFTSSQKEEIFKRDNYKCVICGRGRADGVEIQADHIKPKELGGKAEIENGQTLCAQHNFQKKSYKQTETGKRMFIRLYELAKKNNDKELMKFCEDILKVYEKDNINGHIIWKK